MFAGIRSISAACWFGVLLVASAVPSAVAQRRPPIQEPRWLDLHISRIATGVHAEGDYDTSSFGDGSSPVTYSRLFIGPELGLDMRGSIFHPNFCTVSLVSDGAYGESWQSVRTTSSTSETREMLYLGNVHLNANLLAPKPYGGSLFLDTDHSFRDNDFYSRVISDSLAYGARLRYEAGPWRADGGYSHRDEAISGSGTESQTVLDAVNFNASNLRESGSTVFGYIFTRYDYSGTGNQQSVSDNHSITLSDREEFGSRDQFGLNSRANYSRADYSRQGANLGEQNDHWSGGVDLSAMHSPELRSDYSISADRYESDLLTSSTFTGTAGLTHQLYESLSSTISTFGNSSDYADLATEGFTRRVGVVWGEGYSKRIGEKHTLRINNGLTLAMTSQQGIATVENESHTFSTAAGNPLPDAFFLNQLNVIRGSIRVWDATKTELYQEGVAYKVIVNGAQTLIERRPGVGVGGIPEGSTVLVDYLAEPSAAGDYSTIGEDFRVRLNLWSHLWGVYLGYAFSRSSAGEEFGALNFTRWTLGTDLNWKSLSAGAEFERYDSDQSSYDSFSLYQAASLKLDGGSSLGLNLSEHWIQYIDADEMQQQYRFNAHYHSLLADRLRLDVQAGVSYRTGRWEDEMLAVLRPTLHYRYGQTTMSLDYALGYSMTGGSEERLQNSMRFTISRRF